MLSVHPSPSFLSSLSKFLATSGIVICLLDHQTDVDRHSQVLSSPTTYMTLPQNVSNKSPELIYENFKNTLFVNCPVPNQKQFLQSNWNWLVPEPLRPEEEYNDLKLRLDSNFYSYKQAGDTVDLTEWFKIKGGPLKHLYLGSWSIGDGLEILAPYKWVRRSDLTNVVLKEGILDFELDWPPISIVVPSTDNDTISVTGILAEVLTNLQMNLNFTRELVATPDQDYGSVDSNGNWTGIVRQLMDGDIDISTAGLTITTERSGVIDFTMGLIPDGATIIQRNPSVYPDGFRQSLDFLAYITVFPFQAWLVILTIILMFGFLYMTLKWNDPNLDSSIKNKILSWMNGSAVACSLLLQLSLADWSPLIAQISGRILFLTVAILGIMLFALYTSDLTAFMTAGNIFKTLKSFEDVLGQDFKVIAIDGTHETSLLDAAPETTPMGRVDYLLYDASAFDEAVEIIKKENSYLIYTSALVVAEDQNLVALTDFHENIKSYLSLGLQKDSEFHELFDYHILQMFQSGLVQANNFKWLLGRPSDYSQRIFVEDINPIAINNVFFPIIMLSCGICLAAVICLIERVQDGRKK